MSENKHGSIEIEVIHNLGDVEARLDRILAKLKEAVKLKERLEGVADEIRTMSPQDAMRIFKESVEGGSHDAT